MQGTQVQSLARGLRSHMLWGNRAHTPQLERAHVLQLRPSTVKYINKYIFFNVVVKSEASLPGSAAEARHPDPWPPRLQCLCRRDAVQA